MLRTYATAGLALGLLAVVALPATAAEPVCGSRTDVAKKLAKDFSEKPTAMGLASNGNVIEVYSSIKGDTWTIVMSTPAGQSCLMAAGQAWEMMQSSQVAQGPDA